MPVPEDTGDQPPHRRRERQPAHASTMPVPEDTGDFHDAWRHDPSARASTMPVPEDTGDERRGAAVTDDALQRCRCPKTPGTDSSTVRFRRPASGFNDAGARRHRGPHLVGLRVAEHRRASTMPVPEDTGDRTAPRSRRRCCCCFNDAGARRHRGPTPARSARSTRSCFNDAGARRHRGPVGGACAPCHARRRFNDAGARRHRGRGGYGTPPVP